MLIADLSWDIERSLKWKCSLWSRFEYCCMLSLCSSKRRRLILRWKLTFFIYSLIKNIKPITKNLNIVFFLIVAPTLMVWQMCHFSTPLLFVVFFSSSTFLLPLFFSQIVTTSFNILNHLCFLKIHYLFSSPSQPQSTHSPPFLCFF